MIDTDKLISVPRMHTLQIRWVRSSIIVIASAIAVAVCWKWLNQLDSTIVWWSIMSILLIILLNWWMWTMIILHTILDHQAVEYKLIKSILTDINAVKDELIKLNAEKEHK